MVGVREGEGSCVCIHINTYEGQGPGVWTVRLGTIWAPRRGEAMPAQTQPPQDKVCEKHRSLVYGGIYAPWVLLASFE